MTAWEVVRAISAFIAPIVGIALAVIGFLIKDRLEKIDVEIRNEARERGIEYASMRSKLETMGDEREQGDSRIHERLNDLERRLPQEYARVGLIDSLERRVVGIETEMKEGFRHTGSQLQEIMRMLKQ